MYTYAGATSVVGREGLVNNKNNAVTMIISTLSISIKFHQVFTITMKGGHFKIPACCLMASSHRRLRHVFLRHISVDRRPTLPDQSNKRQWSVHYKAPRKAAHKINSFPNSYRNRQPVPLTSFRSTHPP